MVVSRMLTIVSSEKTPIYYTKIIQKSISKKGELKMEMTMQEKLIQFIHDLTDEECDLIVSRLMQEETEANLSA